MATQNSSHNAPEEQRPDAESVGVGTSQLLQQMLESALLERKPELTSAEWQGLRAIAHDAQVNSKDHVQFVAELCQVLLATRFAHFKNDAETCERICLKIARVLTSDPYARKRLGEFQQHLLQSTS